MTAPARQTVPSDAELDALLIRLRRGDFVGATDAIAALRSRVRELESAPTSGEVASLVKALYARGQKIEWDGGDVSADQQILHAADVIARLDRERQALQAEVIASDDRASRLAGWHDDEVKRADRAESALARVTLERDALREGLQQMV